MKSILLKRMIGLSLSVAIVGSLLMVTSCSDDEGTFVPTETILQIIDNTDGLDSLSKYLGLYGGDAVALLGAPGSYTVFAPNNAAFVSLLATPGFPADIADINPEILSFVLSYHVVAGQSISSSELGADMTTLASAIVSTDVIQVNSDGTLLTGSTNDAIAIVDADNEAINGVVHITGTVLIPQSVGATLTQLLGSLAGAVSLSADFTHLNAMITKADLEVPAGQEAIINILADPTGTLTLFAPPNAVLDGAALQLGFADFDAFLAAQSSSDLRSTLLNHVLTTIEDSAALTAAAGGSVTSALGLPIEVALVTPDATNPTGILLTAPGGSAPVLLPDQDTELSIANGVLHVIGGVLLPQ